MALMDLKSNLSWYGKKPKTVDNITNKDQEGFTANIMPIGASRPASQYTGIKLGKAYKSTSLLGTLNSLTPPPIDYTDTKFILDGASPSIMSSGFADDGSKLAPRSLVARDQVTFISLI